MTHVAVITGSNGGIGRALLHEFVENGYCVVAIDRVISQLPESDQRIDIDMCLLTFAKDESYREMALRRIKASLPENVTKLVLINNAAVQILKPLEEIRWMDWESSLAVNLVAPLFLVQGLTNNLKQANGRVINISSIHAKLTKPQFTCYAASKSALEALTRSLALELSPLGISVNAVAPAAIATQMLKDGFAGNFEKLEELAKYHPSNCIGAPEHLAVFIKSIAEHDGPFLTGSVLEYSGGIGGCLSDPAT